MKTIFLALIFLSAAMSVLAQPPKTGKKSWKKFETNAYGIQYPDTLQLDNSRNDGTDFLLLTSQTSANDLFKENINLLVQDLSGKGVDLTKFVIISEQQILEAFGKKGLIESKRLKGTSGEYQRLIFGGKSGNFEAKWLQYYFVKNEKAYILTLTCETKQFENYLAFCEKIMKTFFLK
jgi:hypothetical protein